MNEENNKTGYEDRRERKRKNEYRNVQTKKKYIYKSHNSNKGNIRRKKNIKLNKKRTGRNHSRIGSAY